MCNIGLAVILAALIGAAAGGAAAIWFTNRDWRRRLAEFEECQTFLNESVLGEHRNFLKENVNVSILFYNGKPIGVSLPNSVDLRVAKCDPGVRGDTVSGALKPAVLETGYQVQVPLFINEGDILKIDTRDGKYLTRVASAQ